MEESVESFLVLVFLGRFDTAERSLSKEIPLLVILEDFLPPLFVMGFVSLLLDTSNFQQHQGTQPKQP